MYSLHVACHVWVLYHRDRKGATCYPQSQSFVCMVLVLFSPGLKSESCKTGKDDFDVMNYSQDISEYGWDTCSFLFLFLPATVGVGQRTSAADLPATGIWDLALASAFALSAATIVLNER